MYKRIFLTPVPYRTVGDPSLGSGPLEPLYNAYPDLTLAYGEVIHSVYAFFVNAEDTPSSPFTIMLAVNMRTIYHPFVQMILKFDGMSGDFLGYEDPFYAPPGYIYSEVVQSIDGGLWASTGENLVPLDTKTRAAMDESTWIPATFFEIPADQTAHEVHHPMVDKAHDLIVMSASPPSVDGRYILVNRFSTGELLRRIWVSGPVSQIIQEDDRRCFVVCSNGILNVVDFTTGAILSTTSSPAVHTTDGQAVYAWAPSLRRLLAFNFVDANRAFLGGPPVNSDGSSPDTISGYYPVPIATNITKPIPLKPPRKGRTVPLLVRAVGDAGEAIASLPLVVTATAPGSIGTGAHITDASGYARINLTGADAGSSEVTVTANVGDAYGGIVNTGTTGDAAGSTGSGGSGGSGGGSGGTAFSGTLVGFMTANGVETSVTATITGPMFTASGIGSTYFAMDLASPTGAKILGRSYQSAPGSGVAKGLVFNRTVSGQEAVTGTVRAITKQEVADYLNSISDFRYDEAALTAPSVSTDTYPNFPAIKGGFSFNVDFEIDHGYVAHSGHKLNWNSVVPPASNWERIAWSPELGIMVYMADFGGQVGGDLMTSADGINWTSHFDGDNRWKGPILWSEQAQKFIYYTLPTLAGGSTILGFYAPYNTMVSDDGINWQELIGAPDVDWAAVVAVPSSGITVGIGQHNGPVSGISYDGGLTWSLTPLSLITGSQATAGVGLVWAAELNKFVAVFSTDDGVGAITSADGINWTAHNTPIGGWGILTWIPSLGLLVAGGSSRAVDEFSNVSPYSFPIMTSADGINWDPVTNIFFPIRIGGLMWIPEQGGIYANAQIYNSKSGNPVRVALTSADGINWSLMQPSVGGNLLHIPELGKYVSFNGWTDGTSESTTTYYWPYDHWVLTYSIPSTGTSTSGGGGSGGVSGATLFVATTGSDSNDGASAISPFRTIQKAVTVATAGDIVSVASGTYAETIYGTNDGTSSQPIKFVSATQWGAKIVPPAANSSRDTAWDHRGDYVTIDGFEVDGTVDPTSGQFWRVGINVTGTNSLVTRCHVHHIYRNHDADSGGGAGILCDSYYGKNGGSATRNRVHHIGPASGVGGGFVQGIYFTTAQAKIENNVVNNVTGYGIHGWHDVRDTRVTNNTSFHNGEGGFVVGGGDYVNQSAPCDYMVVTNNIAYGNTGYGFSEQGGNGAHNIWSHNLANGNGTDWSLNTSTHVSDVTGSPGFVNYQADGSGDYHLHTGSPAIGAGLATYAPTTDYSGVTRTSPFDLGAYKYTGT